MRSSPGMKVEPKVLAAPTPVEPATLHQLMWCVLFCWETALLRPFRPPLMADTTTLAAVGDTVFAPSVLGPLKGVSGMRAPSVSGDVGGFPPAPPPWPPEPSADGVVSPVCGPSGWGVDG